MTTLKAIAIFLFVTLQNFFRKLLRLPPPRSTDPIAVMGEINAILTQFLLDHQPGRPFENQVFSLEAAIKHAASKPHKRVVELEYARGFYLGLSRMTPFFANLLPPELRSSEPTLGQWRVGNRVVS